VTISPANPQHKKLGPIVQQNTVKPLQDKWKALEKERKNHRDRHQNYCCYLGLPLLFAICCHISLQVNLLLWDALC